MNKQHKTGTPKRPEEFDPGAESQGGQSDKSESGFIAAENRNKGAPNAPREIPSEPDKMPKPPVKEIDQGQKPFTGDDPATTDPPERAKRK